MRRRWHDWRENRRGARWVHPATHQIFKFLPNNPPTRGEHVLVDGVRCLVLRVKVSWEGSCLDVAWCEGGV